MKIQIRKLAIALATVLPLTVAATAKSSAAPINGGSAVRAVTTDVRYRANRDYPYASDWGYPTYYYYGYPIYGGYYAYPGYYGYPGYWTHSPYWNAYGWW